VDIVDPAIERYLHEWTSPLDPVLREMELFAAEDDFPIVGPQVGQLLHVLARSVRASRVIELGSGFGYSAYWFARAVGPAGRVVLTEYSEERAEQARRFLGRGGLLDRVEFHVGDAIELAAHLEGDADILFNDIDKPLYPRVPAVAGELLRDGGLLISDNMLWFGSVLDEVPREPSAQGVKELTRQLFEDPAFETALLPIRDGLSVSVYRRQE
jgi:predicted O-methyltransferase YrrM